MPALNWDVVFPFAVIVGGLLGVLWWCNRNMRKSTDPDEWEA